MPKIEIRPAVATDVAILMKMDHSVSSDYVWQMDFVQGEDQAGAAFREIRLPRSIQITYPRPIPNLSEDWSRNSGMLVATAEKVIIGYTRISEKVIPYNALITDVVVSPAYRRKGVGSALVLSAQGFASKRGSRQIMMEMTSKNAAGIRLARKMGYEFCGYNDHYYLTQEVALFFVHSL